MSEAKRDQNFVPGALGVSTADSTTTLPFKIDSSTGRLLVDNSGGGSGTVTDVSVVSANGFAGTVATSTTTPAITLTTTITGLLKGNGTAISAASAGTDYVTASSVNTFTNKTYDTAGSGNAFSINGTAITAVTGTGAVVLAAAPTFTSSITVGVAAGTTGSILFKGTTSGTITLKSADAAGTYTLTLPTDDGDSGQVLSTNGSGVLSWVSAGGVPTTITVANEATDTSCFIAFFTAATGDLGPKTNANMTFDSNTGIVTFASSVLTTTDINGGTIDGTVIGGTSAAAITGTTITANTGFMPDANDGAYLGQSGTAFSDLFLASGAIIDFAAGNSVITHSAAVLTVSTGDLRVTTAGTNSASVVTVGGTQTLTSKTLTSPTITTATLSGAQQLAEGASLRLDAAGSADGAYSGITISGTAGATLAFGDLIYLAAADSRWELTDADAASTSGDVQIGMCVLAAAADGDPTVILLYGNIRADAVFPALTIGGPAYVGTTAGDIQTAQPSGTDDVIRRVGFALTADELLFNPSNDYVTHT